MTQPARTTESESRDNAAIREIMHQIQDRLTVPDRATLALGLVGHLATLMNGRQIEKLLGQLSEQASKVQDVPPSRRQDRDVSTRDERNASSEPTSGGNAGPGRAAGGELSASDRNAASTRNAASDRNVEGRTHAREVGVQGRGALTDDAGPIL